jgi:hypothetical protein
MLHAMSSQGQTQEHQACATTACNTWAIARKVGDKLVSSADLLPWVSRGLQSACFPEPSSSNAECEHVFGVFPNKKLREKCNYSPLCGVVTRV